jgi:adenylate cyclase
MEAIRPERTRLSHLLLLALAAAVLVSAWYLTPGGGEQGSSANLLDRLEYRTVDWRFGIRSNLHPLTPDPRLLILEVDDAALQRVGQWPWPRQTWARVTDLLVAAGAHPIIFDIFFPEREANPADREARAGGDQALVEATRRAGMVYHAAFASSVPQKFSPGAADPLSIPVTIVDGKGFDAFAGLGSFSGVLAGFPELTAAAAGVGYADVLDAGDGIYRYVLPVATVGEKVYPSLALRVAMQTLAPGQPVTVEKGRGVRVGSSFTVPLDRAGRLAINFAGPRGTYPHRNVADLLDGKIPADQLRGKIVLIAATAPGLHDLRPSPYGAIFDGVEAQANILDNILTGRYLRELQPERVVFLLIVMALVSATAFWAMRALFATLASAAMLMAYEAAAVWAFTERGLIVPVLVPALTVVLALVALLVYAVRTHERTTHTAYRTFGKYVAAEVVRRLAEHEEITGQGVRRTATVLFSDLRNFTGSTARLQPEEVVSLLNRYFTLMYETLTEFEGVLDKYLGDGLMAYFLSDEGDTEHAVLAVHAALEMQRRIEVNREEWVYYGMPELRAGIGIATGEEILGDIGSPDRMEYTLIGPEVNLAARLVELTKTAGADIIMDARTYELAKDYIDARCLGPVAIHGLEEPQVVYEARAEGAGNDTEVPSMEA